MAAAKVSRTIGSGVRALCRVAILTFGLVSWMPVEGGPTQAGPNADPIPTAAARAAAAERLIEDGFFFLSQRTMDLAEGSFAGALELAPEQPEALVGAELVRDAQEDADPDGLFEARLVSAPAAHRAAVAVVDDAVGTRRLHEALRALARARLGEADSLAAARRAATAAVFLATAERPLHYFTLMEALVLDRDQAAARDCAQAIRVRWPESAVGAFWRAAVVPTGEAGAVTLLSGATTDATIGVVAGRALALVQAGMGDASAALATCDGVLALRPADVVTGTCRARALIALGRLPEAALALEAVLVLGGEDAALLLELGDVRYRLGAHSAATAALVRAVDLGRDDGPSLRALARAARAAGDRELACDTFGRLLARGPGEPADWIARGELCRDLGRLDDARNAARRAVELSGDGAAALDESIRELAAAAARHDLLQAFLEEARQPTCTAGRIDLARAAAEDDRSLLACETWAGLLTEERALIRSRRDAYVTEAARAAARVALGRGRDVRGLDALERGKWRRQALYWLDERLLFLDDAFDLGLLAPARVAELLEAWRRDDDLSRFRDEDTFEDLPYFEWESWRDLWRRTEALVTRATAR